MTPAASCTALSAHAVHAMRQIGNEAKSSTPAELRQLTLEQSKGWGDLVERFDIKAE